MGREICKALTAFLLLLTGCVKDKPPTVTNTGNLSGSAYVVCEGNFNNGDASLYLYNRVNNTVNGDIYRQVNNQALGDVFQSMTRIGDFLYLCINNSDKVIVLDAVSKKQSGTIYIPKPRYILAVSYNKAYVSALYDRKLYIVNPQTMLVTGAIEMPALNPEGMCMHNGIAYVCCWDTACNKLYSIDPATDKIRDSFNLAGYAPQEVLADKQQTLWVLGGNKQKGKSCTFTRIDPSTRAQPATIIFNKTIDAIKPAFNRTQDTMYFIEVDYTGQTTNNGIYRLAVERGNTAVEKFIPAEKNQYFWALGIDPATGEILVGDPKGFTQKGSLLVYKPDGTLSRNLPVGWGPGHFYFE